MFGFTPRWLFVDMNSYFASVEQHDRPELRGKPVAVAPLETDATCCIAANTLAKRSGVRTGTAVSEARRLCPGIVIVKARPAFYVHVHHAILHAVERCAPIEKVYSIDEWSVKLTGPQRHPQAALALGHAIKASIAHHVGPLLTCSVGVADTRLLAKIACDLHKPDGLTLLPTSELPARLAHLRLDDLPGISDAMAGRLVRAGVSNLTQLWALSRGKLAEVWGGVHGEHWWCGLHGIGEPEPVTHRHSMGHAHVLPPIYRTHDGAHGVMTRLLHKAAYRLRRHGYVAFRLHAGVRDTAAGRWDRLIDLPGCSDTLTILEHFERLWSQAPRPPRPMKVAVTLMELQPVTTTPAPLFPGARHRDQLSRAIDRLNDRYGRDTLCFGGMLNVHAYPMDDKIAFGRVPEQAERIVTPPPPGSGALHC